MVCVCAALALTAGAARGAEPHPHVGRLPGYPVIRGVVPVLESGAAVSAHEQLVNGAFAAVRAREAGGLAEPNEKFLSKCDSEASFVATQDMCYRGGPVLRDPTIHLIFWQGPVVAGVSTETNVEAFTASYIETVARYFEDVSHDNGAQTNVFAVDPQYFDENSKGELVPGEYALSFENGPADVTVDPTPFPKHVSGCSDNTEFSQGPCLLDSDIQAEVEKVAKSSTKGLGDLYVVLTPKGVGGCFEAESGECAYRQYCAYHGDFGGDGHTPGDQTLYVDLPYLGEVPGCDSGVHPNEAFSEKEEEEAEQENELLDGGADAVIDTASHEVNEAIADPIGSQCATNAKKASECERNAWTDVIGQEMGDKCLPPESTVFGIYGGALGEVVLGRPARAYNQEINGHPYYTQREWSNEAGLEQGGCVQRVINARFTVSTGARATVPVMLDASSSGASGDPAVYFVWTFVNGEQLGTESPTISRTFPRGGEEVVGLTAYDGSGNAETTVGAFIVGAAPIPPPPPPAPTPLVIKEPVTPGHITSAELARRLGLPVSGKKLSGVGSIALGHAECPPACGVTLRLYAKVTTGARGRRVTKRVSIGTAHLTLAAKGTATLGLSLNAKGRAMLHKLHNLTCKLIVTVEGQEGGTWQIVRSLTLTR
jgi:hypothetical protein